MNFLNLNFYALILFLFASLGLQAQAQVFVGNHILEEVTSSKIDYKSNHANVANFAFKSSTNKVFGSVLGWAGAFGLRDRDNDWFITTFADRYATIRVDNNIAMRWYNNGKVLIGDVDAIDTSPAGYKLFVEEGILAEKVRVAVNGASDWADYVFEDDYDLMPLSDVKTFIEDNDHLPNVPSAEEMVNTGLDILESDAILLRKIEEAYLYILQQQEQLDDLKKEIANLRN